VQTNQIDLQKLKLTASADRLKQLSPSAELTLQTQLAEAESSFAAKQFEMADVTAQLQDHREVLAALQQVLPKQLLLLLQQTLLLQLLLLLQQIHLLQLLLILQQELPFQLLLSLQLGCSCRECSCIVMLCKPCISTNSHIGYNKIPSILLSKSWADFAGCILKC